MKKKLVAILLCIISIVAITSGTLIAHADTPVDIDTEKLEQYTAELNQTLADNGTTADEQLNIFYNELDELISETSDSGQISKYSTMKKVITEIKNRNINLCSYVDLLPPTATEFTRTIIFGFAEAASAVLKLKKLDLTAELLLKSFVISEDAEPYVPAYGYKIKHSQVFKNIANGKIISGADKFESRSNNIEEDLYFSIHGFDYVKPSASSKTVILSDKYDFSSNKEENKNKGFPDWIIPIISGICDLHDHHYLSFYNIEITEALSSNIEFNDTYGYREKVVNVDANELMDYEATSYYSGRRLIQTFGTSTTELYILNEEGKILASAKGNGYKGNSLISYNFSANKKYVIRIKHADKSAKGTIKLGIFRDSGNVNNYYNINIPTLTTKSYTATASANSMYFAQIVPPSTGSYKITFDEDIAFSAFLIRMDDNETYDWAYNLKSSNNGLNSNGNNAPLKIRPEVSWDILIPEGGSSICTKIEKNLTTGKRYMLVVCGYPTHFKGVKINFNIAKS